MYSATITEGKITPNMLSYFVDFLLKFSRLAIASLGDDIYSLKKRVLPSNYIQTVCRRFLQTM